MADNMNRTPHRYAAHARVLLIRRFLTMVSLAVCGGLALALFQGCPKTTGALGPVAAKPPPPPPKRVHLAAAGDVMLDRGVWNRIKENGLPHVMAGVRDRLRAADLAFVNLECPLSDVQGHARPGGDLVFCADPGTVGVLEDAGVDIVALANNHGMDAGSRGCDDTMDTLAEHNIAFAGGRPKGLAADDVTYLEVNDTVFAFLAYTDLNFEHQAMCKVDPNMQNALARVCEARSHADVVCVSYHWGVEYQKEPTERQVELGHATIDAGADVVLGHHPHVMGGVEWYHDGLILYSMGNFVFDQRDADDGRMNSAVFNLYFTVGSKLDLVITPLRIPTPAYAPEPASAERGQAILAELVQLSADRGTNLRIEGQKAKGSFTIATPKRPAAPAKSDVQPAALTAERDHA